MVEDEVLMFFSLESEECEKGVLMGMLLFGAIQNTWSGVVIVPDDEDGVPVTVLIVLFMITGKWFTVKMVIDLGWEDVWCFFFLFFFNYLLKVF